MSKKLKKKKSWKYVRKMCFVKLFSSVNIYTDEKVFQTLQIKQEINEVSIRIIKNMFLSMDFIKCRGDNHRLLLYAVKPFVH